MTIFLELGQQPDEPGPPIHGPACYPDEVTTRLRADAATVIDRYPHPRSALLPLLHLVQAEDGCLTPAGIAFCAAELGLTDAEVTAVATFYSMYRRTPTGDYLVGVCTNTLCAIMGGDAILETLTDHLGVRPGETTDDGVVTLEHVECNAACDYAPVMMVNWEFMDNMTPESAVTLVDDLRAGKEVSSTRGPRLCSWREAERVLAGFPDGRADEGPGAGPASLRGLEIAREKGWSAPAGADGSPAAVPASPQAAAAATDASQEAESAAVEADAPTDTEAAEKKDAQ